LGKEKKKRGGRYAYPSFPFRHDLCVEKGEKKKRKVVVIDQNLGTKRRRGSVL